ncbi:MAG TPA: DRTGG domain-containing protein [Candidatus Atribacteria bacterium]|nr:DRTGG domain-containing protein [Candidatus Atribacteria bacterium]HPU08369.1 DRTGG domain-containing protein [Candidatus Atribacteria bacterium]HPZ81281.1 DRTGG domain-containing protein [Candidatus Atribacteria bacterium]HQE24608.1 DRTGG domain-containing protein [Candidatus Atribacteria bacterium]
MTLREIKEILQAQVLAGEEFLDRQPSCACGSDLLSDVLAFTKENSVLLTGLTNPQVIRTAEMSDIIGIIFVRGKKPDNYTVELATIKKIPLLATHLPMYESCGKLYLQGLKGCSEV